MDSYVIQCNKQKFKMLQENTDILRHVRSKTEHKITARVGGWN